LPPRLLGWLGVTVSQGSAVSDQLVLSTTIAD